jgi:hypothetical protein
MGCKSDQKLAAHVDLTINGEKIGLNSFVEGFISQTVLGMVKSLRGVSDAETIELKISK